MHPLDPKLRVSKNGANYRCLECGARGRDLPVCEHCEPPKPKKKAKKEPEPEPVADED